MRQKLLLADDSITVQRVIELTFSDEGLDIVTVGDGAQAIEHLRRDRADIVLADLNMPNVDGYAVAEHVKRTPDLVARTRVVLLTGAFEPVDQDRAQKLGVDGILAKPFEPQVAIELVRQLLAQPPLSPPRTVTAAVAAVASPSDWAVDVSARAGRGGRDNGAAESKPPAGGGVSVRARSAGDRAVDARGAGRLFQAPRRGACQRGPEGIARGAGHAGGIERARESGGDGGRRGTRPDLGAWRRDGHSGTRCA